MLFRDINEIGLQESELSLQFGAELLTGSYLGATKAETIGTLERV